MGQYMVNKYLTEGKKMADERQIKLGDKVADKVTGYTGTVSGICNYLHGTTTCCVEASVDAEGKVSPDRWYPPMRLIVMTD